MHLLYVFNSLTRKYAQTFKILVKIIDLIVHLNNITPTHAYNYSGICV